jgi:UDP-2,4-diacetamido-2,4,6-trideoxy-beta-L-altropyranose hydrolase
MNVAVQAHTAIEAATDDPMPSVGVRDRSVAFRVDAGPAIGIGHLRRCLTLAAALSEQGCNVRLVCKEPLGPDIAFLVAPYTTHWLRNVHRDTNPHSAVDEELWDAEATLFVLGKRRTAVSWIVVDSYRLGYRWERKVRDAGHRIFVIDDYRDRRHHADLLLSDSETPFDPALNELARSARALVGGQYALVDPAYEFSGVAANRATGPKRILVSYGGGDPTGETLKALEAIRALSNEERFRAWVARVDIVAGLMNPRSAAIVCAAENIPDVIVHKALPSLEPLMREADVVLTAGGNSMVEALALRKPCIVTVTGNNQALMVGELDVEGVIQSLGVHATVTSDDVLRMVIRVLADFNVFAARIVSKPVFDHLGAHRVASAMLEHVT